MLITDDVQDECGTIKDVMKVETEAKVDEPLEEYVKHLDLKPVDIYAEADVDVVGYK